ncbi:type II CAAX prenyl endopeptidase Rce1 family protein [Paenibacillus sp.]|uniref:CPBP family glutamic-type intramembrane protease n=1 Tax=Paenibacillus sp. TaxID=58172 RepID=UPI002D221A61|nr:CPBP family glutamic-type intramembrane protease [Paenibacillus sp.]HZG88432.1 CPBP family glutamic-type intramembrane protease [Paenibacillus sp.]
MKKKLAISLGFAAAGFLAGTAIIPSQLESVQNNPAAAAALSGMPVPVLMLAAGLQIAVLSFLLSLAGQWFAEKVGLRLTSPISGPWLAAAVLGGMVGAGAAAMLDAYVFLPRLPQIGAVEVTWWKSLLAGVTYGGVFEEVGVRLFLMSAIAWLLLKLTKGARAPWVYWTAIIVSTFVFAAGHLPATAALFGGLTPLIVARALLLNGALGLFFGYLYWKKGLSYAIVSHISVHLFVQGVVNGLIL